MTWNQQFKVDIVLQDKKLRRVNEKDIKHSCQNLVSFEQINEHGYFNTYALECV